jgi:hypothetical protein
MFNQVDHPLFWASSLSLLASVSLWFLVGRRVAASGRRSALSLPETLVSASSATRPMALAEHVHIQSPTWTERNLQPTSEPRGRMALKPASRVDEVPGYTQLQRQIHHALRTQHPEWLQPNGDSPLCDSYESRFAEVLRTLQPKPQ